MRSPLRVGLGQVDTRLGDLATNTRHVREAVAALAAAAPDVVVFPELVVTGYPPRDLLLDPAFVQATLQAQEALAAALAGGPPVLVGGLLPGPSPAPGHPGLRNAALLLRGGRVEVAAEKQLLPVGDVFEEPRWFQPGRPRPPLDLAGWSVGVLVCEDLWDEGYPLAPAAAQRAAGAELLLTLNASPFREGVLARRLAAARRAGLPLVYANAVGAHDELVFDGRSLHLDAAGGVRHALPAFEEAVDLVALGEEPGPAPAPEDPPDLELLRRALVAGLRGFLSKNGLRHAVVGLSGGIDSAVVACLASEALGPGRLTCVALPSRHTDPRSTEAARTLAAGLGQPFEVVPLDGLHRAAEALLDPVLGPPRPGDATGENLQARLRMIVLMALVNRRGGLLLATANKTELALGYTTLYGDLAGGLCPLGDLPKPRVQALARHLVAGGAPIPAFVLERPPSAELAPGQVDPFDYAVVGPRVEAEVLARAGLVPLPAAPLDPDLARRMRLAEAKRWQAPIVLKVSERAFGSGRRVPVTRA